MGRVNYILRAMKIQPGQHQVVLSFKPKSLERTETMAYVSYGILLVAILLGLFFGYRNRKEKI